MIALSLNGPEFVAISVCLALVVLILVSKIIARLKRPRRLDAWWDAESQTRKGWFDERKAHERDRRDL
jgi:hypothetical protein